MGDNLKKCEYICIYTYIYETESLWHTPETNTAL